MQVDQDLPEVTAAVVLRYLTDLAYIAITIIVEYLGFPGSNLLLGDCHLCLSYK